MITKRQSHLRAAAVGVAVLSALSLAVLGLLQALTLPMVDEDYDDGSSAAPGEGLTTGDVVLLLAWLREQERVAS